MTRSLTPVVIAVSLGIAGPAVLASPPQVASAPQQEQDAPRPVFSATVARVPISAVVTDSKNRPIKTLKRDEFEVLENGAPRTILDFSANDNAPVALAILFDTSGSMGVGTSFVDGRAIVRHVLGWMGENDEAALFTFSTRLREEVPFTSATSEIDRALGEIEPLGMTSLYDAIGATAAVLATRPARRQAVVVVTDGIDNGSALTPDAVSAAAAAIDVPVYILAAVAPLNRPEHSVPISPILLPATTLADLASHTGGTATLVSAPAHASIAARQLIDDLRHQYVLAIAAATEPGWYALRVNARHGKLTVRSRSGYLARPSSRIGSGSGSSSR
jgi:Ca-activated chloride channel family protein